MIVGSAFSAGHPALLGPAEHPSTTTKSTADPSWSKNDFMATIKFVK